MMAKPNRKSEEVLLLRRRAWFDMCAEQDSRHLEAFLGYLVKEKGLTLNPESKLFLQKWRSDENAHYAWFVDLFALLSGTDKSKIRLLVECRRPNFAPLEKRGFFQDEFNILMMLVLDEIASARDYKADIPKFDAVDRLCGDGIRQAITRDEAMHYHDTAELVCLLYSHREKELRSVTEGLVNYYIEEGKKTQIPDNATFALDARAMNTNRDFLFGVRETALKFFRKRGMSC